MKELSLFSGAGGGVLGSILLGHRIIGYVEKEDYCQKVIAQRIKDGYIDDAPIFTDIKAFNREGYAAAYTGLVDVISGGFPCQDISCAGKGAGIKGKKSGLWFEMAETIRIIRPEYVFIENSPALLVRGFDEVLRSLFKMGYDATWGIISAADVGAPHLRKRIWILAHAEGEQNRRIQQARMEADIITSRFRKRDVSNPVRKRLEKRKSKPENDGKELTPAFRGNWWKSEPELGRVVDGVADKLDLY
jgi:DNA (cytosine-5)-methyltransferase 1